MLVNFCQSTGGYNPEDSHLKAFLQFVREVRDVHSFSKEDDLKIKKLLVYLTRTPVLEFVYATLESSISKREKTEFEMCISAGKEILFLTVLLWLSITVHYNT